MKILVIHNTSAIKNLLLESLSQKGYELTFSTDSNDALRLIKKRKDIRIVIAELNMPEMDGIELCKQIRSAEFPYYIRLRMANEILRGNLVSGQEAQKSLLPSCFSDMSNMEFAASFIPSAFGSGDIYNIFRLDETNIGLYNIDVSGHGVSAALFSVCLNQRLIQGPQSFGLVKVPLTAPPFYHINSPVSVVTSLDEEDMLGKYGRYFTMVYAIVNVDTGGISFYRAGHNYPLLIHDRKNSCYIEGGGPPIGLGIALRKSRQQDIKLEAGDQLIFFSDGINDAFSPKSEKRYGLERARQILTEHYPESLERSFDRLIFDVQEFMGQGGFSDDISIIGFKWLGSRVN